MAPVTATPTATATSSTASRAAEHSTVLTPHFRIAKPYEVSKQLQRFCRNRISNSVNIHSVEVGGGGDCFFHSVAAGLERMLLHSHAASRHVLRHMPFEIFSTDARTIVKHLRFFCAEQIRQWPPEELFRLFHFCHISIQHENLARPMESSHNTRRMWALMHHGLRHRARS